MEPPCYRHSLSKLESRLSKKAKGTGVTEGLETKRVYKARSERGVNIVENKEVIVRGEDFRVEVIVFFPFCFTSNKPKRRPKLDYFTNN